MRFSGSKVVYRVEDRYNCMKNDMMEIRDWKRKCVCVLRS